VCRSLCCFNAKGKRLSCFRASGRGKILVVFQGCSIASFGYPNDEALAGHPLYKSGLEHYGFYEVMHFPWPAQLEEQNHVMFPGSRVFQGDRHFAVTFHDSTFECLAASFVWRWMTEP